MLKTRYFISFFLLLAFLSGCSKPTFFTKDVILMDTFVSIEIRDVLDETSKSKALHQALDKMRSLEKVFNYFDKNSELSRINRLKVGERLVVSSDMFRVLKASKVLNKKTKGAFDASMGSGRWALDDETKSVSFLDAGVKINLGGIAKGFIVDEGIKLLKKAGIKNALINAGGDMYCLGIGSGGGWKIGVRDPLSTENVIESLEVRDKAVATSGGYERFLEVDGRRTSEIVDPRTLEPVEKIFKSTTVIAETCMTADALATALYVLSPEEGISVIKDFDGTRCIIISESGRVRTSE